MLEDEEVNLVDTEDDDDNEEDDEDSEMVGSAMEVNVDDVGGWEGLPFYYPHLEHTVIDCRPSTYYTKITGLRKCAT